MRKRLVPPYSPNLNPIERLWKFTKGKLCIKYYSGFKSFKDAIDSIIDGTDNIFKDQAAKLIGEKIQLYDNLVPVCENTFSAKNQEIKQAA